MLENPSPIPAKSAEETELEKNKKTLSELVALRSAFFQQDGEDSNKKSDDKKNFIGEFLAPYLENFGTLKKSWSDGDVARNTGAIADCFTEKFDSLMEKYLPSSPQEKENFDKFKNKILHVEDSNKIKLKSDENLIDQLKEKGVNLQEINDQVKQMALINPFSKDNQSIPIELSDGRKLRLDVKQYAEDLFAHNQLQKNTDANSRNGSQTQQIELSGPLALYGKQKFNEKFPQEGATISISEEEKKSIEGFKQEAERLDQIDRKNEENFAKKLGFKIENNKSPTLETPIKIGEEDLKNAMKLLKGILKSPEKSGTENPSNEKPRKGVGFGLNEVREYSPSDSPSAVAQSQSWRDRVNKSPDPQSPSR
jgi:hypothetical protein